MNTADNAHLESRNRRYASGRVSIDAVFPRKFSPLDSDNDRAIMIP